jgi:ribose/galactose isomerase
VIETSFDRAAVKIACAFDHAGVPLRDAVLSALRDGGLADADDYPPRALAVAAAIVDGEAERGVLVCGSIPAWRLRPARCGGSGRRR